MKQIPVNIASFYCWCTLSFKILTALSKLFLKGTIPFTPFSVPLLFTESHDIPFCYY